MGTRSWNDMFRTQAKFGCLCFLASFNTAAMKFLEKRCALSVRDILFRHLTHKLADNNNVYVLVDAFGVVVVGTDHQNSKQQHRCRANDGSGDRIDVKIFEISVLRYRYGWDRRPAQ